MSNLCPTCLLDNIVATINGPTCTHSPRSGTDWFPANWDSITEHERIKYLEKNVKST